MQFYISSSYLTNEIYTSQSLTCTNVCNKNGVLLLGIFFHLYIYIYIYIYIYQYIRLYDSWWGKKLTNHKIPYNQNQTHLTSMLCFCRWDLGLLCLTVFLVLKNLCLRSLNDIVHFGFIFHRSKNCCCITLINVQIRIHDRN